MSSNLAELLVQSRAGDTHAWFRLIANSLLNHAALQVEGVTYRFGEIEFYLFDEAGHSDPFAHRHPLQRSCGQWYFHREGKSYRGGSFKGLDLSFGPPSAFGGILIRSLVGPDHWVHGPSLVVDALLARSGATSVSELDAAINQRSAWDVDNPIRLIVADQLVAEVMYETARVGLTLKRVTEYPTMEDYILRSYRFVIRPRQIKKGRLHLIFALHDAGHSPKEIHQITGSPIRAIERYLVCFEEGTTVTSMSNYAGKKLKSDDLCRLHGTWSRIRN